MSSDHLKGHKKGVAELVQQKEISWSDKPKAWRSLKLEGQAATALEHRMVNGVYVDRLLDTIEAIKSTPDIAKFNFRIHNRWIVGGRSGSARRSRIRPGGQGRVRLHTRVLQNRCGHFRAGERRPYPDGSEIFARLQFGLEARTCHGRIGSSMTAKQNSSESFIWQRIRMSLRGHKPEAISRMRR